MVNFSFAVNDVQTARKRQFAGAYALNVLITGIISRIALYITAVG